MLHLFAFGDDENLNTLSKIDQNVADTQSTGEVGSSSKQKSPQYSTVSSDKFMEVILKKHHPR